MHLIINLECQFIILNDKGPLTATCQKTKNLPLYSYDTYQNFIALPCDVSVLSSNFFY